MNRGCLLEATRCSRTPPRWAKRNKMNNYRHRLAPFVFTLLTSISFQVMDPSEAQADGWFECIPTQITEINERITVRCSNSFEGTTNYIAIKVYNSVATQTLDLEKAKRFLFMANSAMATQRFFYVYLLTSPSSNVAGCLATNCRTPIYFGMRRR